MVSSRAGTSHMARHLENPSGAGFEDDNRQRRLGQKIAHALGWILLVDDDEAFCYAAAKALRMAGFNVSVAPDHRLALRILEGSDPIDLLITDIVMPGQVNGFALARMGRMRRLDLKVLYLTAYDVPTHEAFGKVVRKPILLDALVAEARSALATCGDKMSVHD